MFEKVKARRAVHAAVETARGRAIDTLATT
jgi:hypothetical protein